MYNFSFSKYPQTTKVNVEAENKTEQFKIKSY